MLIEEKVHKSIRVDEINLTGNSNDEAAQMVLAGQTEQVE